jgi:phosphatidylserine/phosphatidylglycerophosphate/cardiolipin synthase-like enzyme
MSLQITSGVQATSASATPALTPAKPVDTWTLRSGQIFSAPKGLGNNRALVDTLIKIARYTPKGETITASSYAISDKQVAEALIAAKKKRGVNVQVTTWTHGANGTKTTRALSKKLKKALGTNTKAKSYYKLCKGSCYITGKDKAAHHAKVFLSSRVVTPSGQVLKNVALVMSANLSKAAAKKSWNQTRSSLATRRSMMPSRHT